jgi:predicted heme/steroid binding protein
MKKFNENELKAFDGSKPDTPVYFAYRGKVYDATDSPLFKDGVHFEHYAGCDLTDDIEEAPHGEDAFVELPVVGVYGEE